LATLAGSFASVPIYRSCMGRVQDVLSATRKLRSRIQLPNPSSIGERLLVQADKPTKNPLKPLRNLVLESVEEKRGCF
jgi:hypothetical protein